MVITRKNLSSNENNRIKEIAQKCDLLFDTTKVLYMRGYDSVEKIQEFLNPSKEQFNDPFLLNGMNEAVERIKLAKQNNELVLVYGDYDADGICSTSILYNALLEYGLEVACVIPERENGYGLTEEVIEQAVAEYCPALLITVDCGISCHDAVEYLKDIGVDVIVTDHHEIPTIIPECTCVNCKFSDQEYPYRNLSGAGVAYKLSKALLCDLADKYLALVAIATIGDSMPLDEENRAIVYEGIKLIKDGKVCKGIKGLFKACQTKEINATSIAFSLVPRINAAGRMNDARSALQLLLSNDDNEIEELSKLLITYNIDRQVECEALYNEAKASIAQKKIDKIVIIYGEDWKTGLVGIVSAKICEEYNLPVIIFVGKGDEIHGSARSIEGVNIYETIQSAQDILKEFGGHAQAAGVTIHKNDIDEFERRLNAYLNQTYDDSVFQRKTLVEDLVEDRFSMRFAKELLLLEPFGAGNRKPYFAISEDKLDVKQMKAGSQHLLFSAIGMDFLYFNSLSQLDFLRSDTSKVIVFEPSISEYNGREYLRGIIKTVETIATTGDSYISYGKDTYMRCLAKSLQSLKSSGYLGYTRLNTQEIKDVLRGTRSSGFGTLYILSNVQNSVYFDNLKWFDCNIFTLQTRGGRNCFVIGGVPEDDDFSSYDRLVYLDKPIKVDNYPNFKEVIVNEEIDSFDMFKFKPSREEFGEIYRKIYALLMSNDYVDEFDVYKDIKGVTQEQFVFAFEVFKELGFIEKTDKIKLNTKIKRELTESRIYNHILELK